MTELLPLADLVGRLTDRQDRETYAALISYVSALPPADEFRRMAELLGFLALIGGDLPGALKQLRTELQEQTRAASEYHERIHECLAALPQEIAAGVDPLGIAKAMGEAFRQQIATSGLQDTATALRSCVADIQAQGAALKASAAQSRAISDAIAADAAKLAVASGSLQAQNAALVVQAREHSWLLTIALGVILFVIGTLAGVVIEKSQTAGALNSMAAQIERIQQPVAATPAPIARVPRGARKN